ncbi:MAG: glycosyltransferase [Proteobacteria bacterium]|nr:glycosyltransferase [Pseudomonadota bacterium]
MIRAIARVFATKFPRGDQHTGNERAGLGGGVPRVPPIRGPLRADREFRIVRPLPDRVKALSSAPLVSIFLFVRNGGDALRRSVRSVRNQTYPNIEYIVQDAVSTDGTLDIIRQEYGETAKIVSERDAGASDGLWRAMKRCTGEFVGSCLADEELLPDAVERGVRLLVANPHAGAITGNAILTDLEGRQTGFWRSGPFNLVDYLFCDYTPYWVSSFFRRSTMTEAGIREGETWSLKAIEFKTWLHLSSISQVLYVPETFAKYASHPGQSSSRPKDVIPHFSGRVEEILALCARSPLVSGDPRLPAMAIWGMARAFINHAQAYKLDDLARDLYRIACEATATCPSVEVDGVRYDEHYGARIAARAAGQAYEDGLSPLARLLAGKRRIADRRHRLEAEALANPSPGAITLPPPPSPAFKAQLYARLAMGYDAQGRYREAADTWRAAGRLLDLVDPARYPPELPPKYFSMEDLGGKPQPA